MRLLYARVTAAADRKYAFAGRNNFALFVRQRHPIRIRRRVCERAFQRLRQREKIARKRTAVVCTSEMFVCQSKTIGKIPEIRILPPALDFSVKIPRFKSYVAKSCPVWRLSVFLKPRDTLSRYAKSVFVPDVICSTRIWYDLSHADDRVSLESSDRVSRPSLRRRSVGENDLFFLHPRIEFFLEVLTRESRKIGKIVLN